MLVKNLIEELKKLPEDLPVAVDHEIGRHKNGEIESFIEISKCTWEHSNFPYDREPFEYINLE